MVKQNVENNVWQPKTSGKGSSGLTAADKSQVSVVHGVLKNLTERKVAGDDVEKASNNHTFIEFNNILVEQHVLVVEVDRASFEVSMVVMGHDNGGIALEYQTTLPPKLV
ncbi:hypothetical protein ACH5RR_006950 [Cinchona calisaya]|uniref:Uncharacterized protein n=1 Tax=Cinchona calisaya TaxID=153742 RepID=A0ABD3AQD2_9GENT